MAETTYRCPSCQQFVTSDAKTCRHCGGVLDGATAEREAAIQADINATASKASNIKIASRIYAGIHIAALVVGVRLFLSSPARDNPYLKWRYGLIFGIPLLLLAGLSAPPFAAWILHWKAHARTLDPNDATMREARSHIRTAALAVFGSAGLVAAAGAAILALGYLLQKR